METIEIIHLLAVALGLVGMAWIAAGDFRSLKVRNFDVLVLTVIAAVAAATDPSGQWQSSLLIASALFAIGFVLWLAKLIGAGDAKFYFPLGLMVGWSGAGLYVVFLLVTSVAILVLFRIEPWIPQVGGVIRHRLAEIAEKRKVPYGVPMAISGILAVLLT